MHAQMDAESTARVDGKVFEQREARRLAEERANEAARQRTEADRITSLAEEEALKRKRDIQQKIRESALELPSCDAAVATQAVKDKFELVNTPITTISSATNDDPAFGGTVPNPERRCIAQANMKGGNLPISYIIRWRDSDRTKVLVTFSN